MTQGAKFVAGQIADGRLTLVRSDGSVTGELPDAVFVAATLTDNGDATFDLVFPGS